MVIPIKTNTNPAPPNKIDSFVVLYNIYIYRCIISIHIPIRFSDEMVIRYTPRSQACSGRLP